MKCLRSKKRLNGAVTTTDVMVGDAVGADPLNNASPPRETDKESENGGGVSGDSSQPHEGVSRELR
jgi:hypothetical protein